MSPPTPLPVFPSAQVKLRIYIFDHRDGFSSTAGPQLTAVDVPSPPAFPSQLSTTQRVKFGHTGADPVTTKHWVKCCWDLSFWPYFILPSLVGLIYPDSVRWEQRALGVAETKLRRGNAVSLGASLWMWFYAKGGFIRQVVLT